MANLPHKLSNPNSSAVGFHPSARPANMNDRIFRHHCFQCCGLVMIKAVRSYSRGNACLHTIIMLTR